MLGFDGALHAPFRQQEFLLHRLHWRFVKRGFHMATTQEAKAKDLHADILGVFASNAKADRPTVLTLFSLHSGPGGQWIIGDDGQDRKLVAQRLRLAADILEAQ